MQKRLGRQTVALAEPVHILSHAAVGGKMESEGPLGHYFDHLCRDSFFGERTWEKAESAMQKIALSRALEKGLAYLKGERQPREKKSKKAGKEGESK